MFLAELEVSVAGLRMCRLDAKGEHPSFTAHQIRPRRHRRAKTRFLTDDMIGRKHDAGGVGIPGQGRVSGKTGAGCGVSPDRFG